MRGQGRYEASGGKEGNEKGRRRRAGGKYIITKILHRKLDFM